MKPVLTALLTTLFAALLFGCSTTPKPSLPKGSSKGYSSFIFYRPSPENLPEFADREEVVSNLVQKTITSELTSSGLSEGGPDPDLLVSHLILVRTLAVSEAIDDYYVNSGSDILHYAHMRVVKRGSLPTGALEEGSLIIDIVDTKSGKLIYRDYASRAIDQNRTVEERNKIVQSATKEALSAFLR